MTKYAQMRLFATGLLVLVALLFVLAHALEAAHPLLPWVAAFCEAALVGALADWFAVTALFRRPLGLPIPHTAIIPAQKEKLAPALARFVRSDLLSEQWLRRQVQERQLAKNILAWLGDPAHLQLVYKAVVNSDKGAQREASSSNYSLRNELATAALRGLQNTSWRAPALHTLESLLQHPRRREWIAALLAAVGRHAPQQEDWISQHAQDEAPLKHLPLIGKLSRSLSGKFSKKTLLKASETITAAGRDLNHPLHDLIEERLDLLLKEAATNEELHEELRTLKKSLFQPEVLAQWSLPSSGASQTDPSENEILRALGEAFQKASTTPEATARFETLLLSQLNRGLTRYGEALETIMSEALLVWDRQTFSRKIEERVGGDLQYIRISGTLVGGLIGLLLHALKLTF